MMILPAIAFVGIASLFYDRSRSRYSAIIHSTILCAAAAIIIAELTSLFTAYNILWVSVSWMAVIAVMGAMHYRSMKTLKPCQGLFRAPSPFALWEKLLLLTMLACIAVALFNIFIAPPNMPVDSLTCHQPRAFMYYKNQSIHHFATNSPAMLHLGSLNAIMMSQFQILCFGWDGAYKLVQFFAFLITIITVYHMTMMLCHDRGMGIIAGALVCFMPMANLQAVTTQTDLVMTVCCTMAVCLMMEIYHKLNHKRGVKTMDFILLGFSCGLAVLCKLNAGVILIGFALSFAAFILFKLRAKAFLPLLLILVTAFIMVAGYGIRNAMVLDGDFLAMKNAGGDVNFSETGIRGVLFALASAFAITLGSPTDKLAALTAAPSLFVINASAALLGLEPKAAAASIGYYYDFNGILYLSPDVASYPVQSCLVLAASVFFFFYAIKKKKWALLCYTFSCSLGYFLTVYQCLYLESFNRYLIPIFVLGIPLSAFMLQKLIHYKAFWKNVTAIILCCAFLFNAVCLTIFVKGTLNYYHENTQSYDERMGYSYDLSVLDLYRQVIPDIHENQYRSIGLDNQSASSFYIWMRPFISDSYDVAFINTSLRPELEAASFVPDCIIASYTPELMTDTIQYHDHSYVKKFETARVFRDVPDRCFGYYVLEK